MGAIPGDRNKPNWEAMETGDYVLTVYDSAYHYLSKVAYKFHNKTVAEKIWGKDNTGKTWEFMYFLTKPFKFDEPVRISELNSFLNKNYLNHEYRGFTKISDVKIEIIEKEFGSLDQFFQEKFNVPGIAEPEDNTLTDLEDEYDKTGAFKPENLDDERKRILALIVQRRGQPAFRKSLIVAYNGKCAVTGCDALDALEAAHINPYKGEHTNTLKNGLLLRADIHTLFDCGKIAIDSSDMTVVLSEDLKYSTYKVLHGRRLLLPDDPSEHPDKTAIDSHRRNTGI